MTALAPHALPPSKANAPAPAVLSVTALATRSMRAAGGKGAGGGGGGGGGDGGDAGGGGGGGGGGVTLALRPTARRSRPAANASAARRAPPRATHNPHAEHVGEQLRIMGSAAPRRGGARPCAPPPPPRRPHACEHAVVQREAPRRGAGQLGRREQASSSCAETPFLGEKLRNRGRDWNGVRTLVDTRACTF